ncbi:MAG: OB-fold domain-containing protein [Deltaproteobacteria bacterium]
MIEGWPLPSTDDPVDAAFWEAALRGQVAIERCSSCSRLRFPPRPMCPWCQSVDAEWVVMSGRGKIWSFARPHPPLIPVFAELAPYPVVVVELEEDPTIRLVGNVVSSEDGEINEVPIGDLAIGKPVRAVFHSAADDVRLIRWVLD